MDIKVFDMFLAKDVSPEGARRGKRSKPAPSQSTVNPGDHQISTMARMGRLGFLAVAVAFHLIYAYSIFDIYFVSPIVSGMREYSVAHRQEAPAKRLVLFVGMFRRALLSRIDPRLTRLQQATDCEQTRLSNSSPTLPLAPNRRPTGKNRVRLLLSFDRASSSMAHSACRIPESLPSPDLVTSP
jgi:hypothetical protein